MATMIPGKFILKTSKSEGEKKVFEFFSDDSIPGFALYSVLQKNHRSKLTAEVDFMYICNRGILCLEVKGGRIGRENGKWYSINRNGIRNDLNDSPFKQADGCAYDMRKLLETTYGKGSDESNFLVGMGVVFPECIFNGSGDGIVLECMFDNSGRYKDFKSYLSAVFDYWEKEYMTKWKYKPKELSQQQILKIKDLLRSDFESVDGLNLILQSAEKEVIGLTEQQYGILDSVDSNDRLFIEGQAGTGKTLLGVETLRRNVMNGQKVLFMCYNKNLASYVRNSVDKALFADCKITTFHGFVKEILGANYVDNPKPENIAGELDIKSLDPGQYDLIILDEAQDLMYLEVFLILDRILKGGLRKGRCIVFSDPNQNIFGQDDGSYKEVCDVIKHDYGFFNLKLNVNCRNTERIARISAKISNVQSAKVLGIDGPKVYRYVFDGEKEFCKIFSREITNVIRTGGVSTKDIVILSRYKLQNSMLKNCDSVCGLKIIERGDITDNTTKCLNYFTVQAFKGLESKVVFLVDIDGFLSKEDRRLNYVGASRAKLLLYIFHDKKYSEEYDEIIDRDE